MSALADDVAELLAARDPEWLTVERRKPERGMDRRARPYGPARERLDQLRKRQRSIG